MAKRSAPPYFDQSGRLLEKSTAVTNPHPTLPDASLSAPSQRITRSAARLAAETPSTGSRPAPQSSPPAPKPRKRKAPSRGDKTTGDNETRPSFSPPRSTKRLKVATSPQNQKASIRRSSRQTAAMSQPGSSRLPEDTPKPSVPSTSTSKQRSSRNRKSSRDSASQQVSPPRRQKKRGKRDTDVVMKDSEQVQNDTRKNEEHELSSSNDSNEDESPTHTQHEEDEADPFHSGLFGGRSPFGLQSTLRALSGMMSGMSSRLRDMLANLKMKDDPSVQLIALQELSDLLLVSNEDNLAGQFLVEQFVKELVTLMQPSETGEENPEIMLLACRCLANLMEAIRGSVANVVHGGAVPILCQKLLDIQFIDLAEQALSTLAKISVDFPASIVREGGLTACLTYLDFFPTSTQRTAVTTAANGCRNLPHDSFPVVRDVMPTLLHVLSSSDQKVVEQGCLCVCRVVESFKYKPEKLEELIEPDMLKAVLRLLLPGTTNLIGPHIHTQFLRVLAIVSRSSPRLSVELLKMNVVDTLYQILTGISPPSEESEKVIKSDSVHIMQALVHRPREQVYETLNVIYELLPGSSNGSLFISDDRLRSTLDYDIMPTSVSPKAKASAEERMELLKECKPEIKRFAMILLPTLTDTYSSTVNLRVRQKVLLAQLKMLQDLDAQIIEEALRVVPYASFLAAILSQKDHISLVALALQCAELLFERLRDIYQYQFHREGVIAEITKLAELPISSTGADLKAGKVDNGPASIQSSEAGDETRSGDEGGHKRTLDDSNEEDDESNDEEDDFNDDYHGDHEDDMSESDSSSIMGQPGSKSLDDAIQDLVINCAKEFLRLYEGSKAKTMHARAVQVLEDLRELVSKIENCYMSSQPTGGYDLFRQLASYFDGDAIDSITSFELLNSGIIRVLLGVIENSRDHAGRDFLMAFATSNATESTTASTPFGEFIHKLQDLLSRTEHFEVITVNHGPFENRNTVSMLSKQLRLRLVAEDESNIPKPYKNMMVSIHAIANFKALDDYLRPRISLSERPRTSRHRDMIFSQRPSATQANNTATPSRGSDSNTSGGIEQSPQAARQPASSGIPQTDRASRSKPGPSGTSQQKLSENLQTGPGQARRSGRHRLSPLKGEVEDIDEPLECADERHIPDDEDIDDHGGMEDEDDNNDEDDDEDEDLDEDLDEDDGLGAIVDDIEDDVSEDAGPDPTAVNLEVASTGKVTARKEDGTRVATPLQSTPATKASSSATSSAAKFLNNPMSLASRSFSSYAAAMVETAEDWHIEFSIDDKPISGDTTIYRAIHHNRENIDDSSPRNVWSMAHTIRFKRVQGPPPPEPSTLAPASSNLPAVIDQDTMPESLTQAPTTASILRLLGVLHRLNSKLDEIVTDIAPEPPTQFINTKLTAKLNRQLEEPLIVASSCLPTWSEDLGRHFPFLFPFETRHLFLQSTSFGYSRSMARWQGSQSGDDARRDQRRDDRPFAGRLQRQKVRISRTRILESAMKVLELYGSSASVLEIEYFEEVGTGLGPTLEFYSTVSKEFSKKKLKLWRDNATHEDGEYVQSKLGLFPAPMNPDQGTQESGRKQLQYFKSLGKFVARSMLDSRIIDVAFNPTFFRLAGGDSNTVHSIQAIKPIDPELANSLMFLGQFAEKATLIEADDSLSSEEKAQAMHGCEIDNLKIDDLELDFTLPGHPNIHLAPNGSHVPVTVPNVKSYIERVIDMTLGSGIKLQMEAFRFGFSQVFSYSSLKTFTSDELVMLFGRVDEDWSIETLMDSIKADHGFNMDSRNVRNLLATMSEFTVQQRRDFLQFVTGSPKLPIGGFKSLTPMFTVVCRPSEPPYTSDDYLPSVMTCVNYLKLPDYSTAAIMREKLGVAMREGQGAFHLS